jgi:hypothetical protein
MLSEEEKRDLEANAGGCLCMTLALMHTLGGLDPSEYQEKRDYVHEYRLKTYPWYKNTLKE